LIALGALRTWGTLFALRTLLVLTTSSEQQSNRKKRKTK
jgi:hypothetical protein